MRESRPISELPTDWQTLPFDACATQTGIHRKASVRQGDYQATGRFPIVDQGAGLVAGYTDQEELVHLNDLPLILFGDHTRAFKLLDFPFATGADGTKLLRANEAVVDPRFLYYALLYQEIPSRGYSRHFRYLRERSISLPLGRHEQHAVAAVLTKIQAAVEVQDRIVATLTELKAATMVKLFREGLRGEPLKQTEIGAIPKSWTLVKIGDLGELVTGTTPATATREYYDGVIPFISPADVGDLRVVRTSQKTLSESGAAVARPLPPRSVLVVCIGATIGKVGMTIAAVSCTNQQINAIIPNNRFIPEFVHYLLVWNCDRVRTLSTPSPVPLLSKSAFGQGLVAVPGEKSEQEAIARVLCAVDDRFETAWRERIIHQGLFEAMLNQLMTGQVRVPLEIPERRRVLYADMSAPTRLARTERPEETPVAPKGTLSAETLQDIVRRIVETAQPEKIILFGSAVRGEMGPDSDVDLLVVKPGVHRRELAARLYRELADLPVAKDIVVATPEDLERHRDTIGLVYRAALREGRVVYAAA